MANNSPTIVAASLSDDQLKKSIDSLVTHVDEAMKKMVQSTNNAVGEMEAKLKSLGNLKIDSNGSADGGASKRAKAQNAETDAVEKSIAARDKQIKKNQDVATSFDQMAKAQQVAIRSASPSGIRNADTLQTMNIQLDLLRERLREARQQYSSFVALAAHATTTGDKGLFQYATDGVHRYEQEVRNLIPQIRTLQSGIQQMGDVIAPQGHTIQNYVNSLQKANPELAALNAQYKSGTSLLQDQNVSYSSATGAVSRYTEAIRKQAQAIRESKEWQEKGRVVSGDTVYYDPERANVSKRDKQLLLSLEEQIVQAQQRETDEAQRSTQAAQQQTQAAKETAQAILSVSKALGITDEQMNKSAHVYLKERGISTRNVTAPNSSVFQSYDDLRSSIAAVLKVEASQVNMLNTLNASQSQLSASLKQLQGAYNKLGRADRESEQGKNLILTIQKTQRAIQKLQSEASRPIGLGNALALSEKTLDDMAYKLRQLQSYKMGLNVKTQVDEMKQVDKEIFSLKKRYDELMGKNQQMIASNTALGRSWNYMKNRLAFYFTVGAGTSFVKNLIEVRSQYEMNERALGILINSAERGTQIFNELSQMALVSPYTLIELSTAAKQLTAYDVAAKDVVDTTRRLADMAAAVGIPIERLTYALGQIKAYGYLNARDARMFSNAGIPLVKQLAEHYTELEGKMVSTADVYDRIKKKAIDMTDVMQVINKMTDEGGKFFDFQAKMAGTLKVQLANLTLAWNNMLNDIGASEQGTISTGIGLLKELFLEWKNISKMITNLAIGFGIVKVAQLAYYGVVMGTNKAIALEAVLGNRLSKNLRSLASSMNAASMSSTALWVGIATFAAAAVVDILRGNEAMKEFNKTLRENAENTYNDLKKFSENYSGLRESLYKTENGKQTPVDINSEEAKKAWEVLREQIELSSHASDEYIGKLLSIENVSERLRQGFTMIESIQSVSAAIKELGDSSIKLERDWSEWWNLGLLPDGTIGNLQDAYMWLSKIEEKYGSVVNARKVASTSRTAEGFDNVFQEEAKEFVENYETELEKFREDLQVTKQSIIDFIELKGWSGDTSKINEAFKTFTDNLILKNQLNPQQAYTLQLEMEEARSKAAKQALLQRINDEKSAYKISHDESIRQALNADIERYNSWNETNGRSKVEWERFTKWLKEQHISETTAMFRNMDAEDIKSLNFQEGKHAEWVTRMVTQYAKEHKMSIDDVEGYLKNFVRNANRMSIFIPLIISTEDKKSVYDQLGEYDKAVDEADAQIERLTKRIGELNAKKKKSKEETQELANAEQELADAQKAKADAEAKGGHGKKEKKDERAANKAAKQAESELQKALKDELSTIDKVRSIYKDLTKEGMSHANAVERATRGWDETVNAINRVLQKNGLRKLDLSKFAGIENPRELLNILQSQLETLVKRGASTSEIRVLQTKIQTVSVEADKYDLTMITKGLNNELGKLKDEYELAVELDANPELGGIFADYMGIDMNELPKNAEEAAKKAQKYIDKILRENKSKEKIDIASLMGKDAFDKWIKSSGHSMEDDLVKIVDNYRQALHKMQVDESKKQMQEWEKLLEKYAEYEYKVSQIQKEAERERAVARKKGASQELLDAIDERERQELARLSFEEFQKTPEWIVATGDLANMSKSAIAMLIEQIERYKRSASNLSPKQIKQLNSALSKLYKEQRKNNPFKAISNMLDEAKERMATFDEDIKKTQEEIDKLTKKKKESIVEGIADEETDNKLKKAIKRLKELKEAREKTGKVDASSWVSSINETIGAVKSAVGVFNDLAKAISGLDSNDIDKAMEMFDKAGQGAAIGATIGGGWGALIGGVAGFASGIAGAISESFSRDGEYQYSIKMSEVRVRHLEAAYKDLENAIKDGYGTGVIAAKRLAIANKELQLAELRRQLALERARDSKDRDDERIADLRIQIKDMERDIKEATDDIVNDLLGISSVGDAAEEMVGNFIAALRNGEDAMVGFNESVDEMIANMVKKMFVTNVLGPMMEDVWNTIQEDINKRGEMFKNQASGWERNIAEAEAGQWGKYLVPIMNPDGTASGWRETSFEEWRAWAQMLADKGKQDFANATKITSADIKRYAELLRGLAPVMGDNIDYLNGILGDLNLLNSKKETLSALQQGIQGITEDTAGALEGITNGISQQSYLQSDLLTQIRDVVVGLDMDVQLGVFSQILLQLQQSYSVQMAIQGILEGWNNPSGQAVRVELVS